MSLPRPDFHKQAYRLEVNAEASAYTGTISIIPPLTHDAISLMSDRTIAPKISPRPHGQAHYMATEAHDYASAVVSWGGQNDPTVFGFHHEGSEIKEVAQSLAETLQHFGAGDIDITYI